MHSQDTNQPASVSIVIAVFNGVQTLEACLNSCLEQDYASKRVIVVDGGSTDGTVAILKKHAPHLAYWVSEPDEGIYHAWNKALEVTSGAWICFLGADDKWANSSSLSKMMDLAHYPAVNFVCARVRKLPHAGQKGGVFGEPWSYSRMKQRMTVAHAGMLHHVSLFDKFGKFDQTYRIAGDYEFLLRAGSEVRSTYTGEEVVIVGGGGVSSTNLRTVLHEGRRVLSEHPEIGPRYGWIFFLKFCVGRAWWHTRTRLIDRFFQRDQVS